MGATKPEARGETEAALGAAFKAARKAKKWSLAQMADALNTRVNTIRWHEAGDTIMGPDKLIPAARILGVSPALLGAQYRAIAAITDLIRAASANDFGVNLNITGDDVSFSMEDGQS